MGLLDIAGAVLGNTLSEGKGGMAQIAMEVFNQNGGLAGIVAKLQESGLAEQAASWISKGENIPVSGEQISNALGENTIKELAAKFNINADTLSSQIAEHLPKVVDQMTPEGEVNESSGSLVSTILGMFK
jgi:uncharacterized protein YidB (DUF937 family)